jgi:hypothetical protein
MPGEIDMSNAREGFIAPDVGRGWSPFGSPSVTSMSGEEYVTYFTGGVKDQHETGGRVSCPVTIRPPAPRHLPSGHPHREERRLHVGGGIQPRVQEPLRHATGSLATRHTSETVVSGPRVATSLGCLVSRAALPAA